MSTIKVPRKNAKICPKLTKTSERHGRHYGIPVVKQTFLCAELTFHYYLKMLGEEKGLY